MDQNEMKSLKGVVKWFNDAKGFGFIQHTSGRDVFVHYSVITQEGFKTLKDGEEVEYELKEGPKGLQATRVMRSASALAAQVEQMTVSSAADQASATASTVSQIASNPMSAGMMSQASMSQGSISQSSISQSSISQGASSSESMITSLNK